jgi:hypothetical protein
MDIRENPMSRHAQQFICTTLFAFSLFATVSSPEVFASAEQQLKQYSNQPSMEILALSRGRGVPETTFIAFQEIITVANTALESGSVISVTQKTIGLEGESKLCVLFRDEQALTQIGDEIRSLATNIDLLQINDNRCSGN